MLAALALAATVLAGIGTEGIARADNDGGNTQTTQSQATQYPEENAGNGGPPDKTGADAADGGTDATPGNVGAPTPEQADVDDGATDSGTSDAGTTDAGGPGADDTGTDGDGMRIPDERNADNADGDGPGASNGAKSDDGERHASDAGNADASQDQDRPVAMAGGDWTTDGITLVHDGMRHQVDVAGEGGTSLDGMTIELRAIGLTQPDGIVHAASSQAEDAARAAGGTGTHPVDDLLRRIVAGTAYADTAASALGDGMAMAEPAATREGAGSLMVDAGLYLASLARSDGLSQAQLVYAGDSNRSGAMMMLSGQAKLPGTPRSVDAGTGTGANPSLMERARSGLTSLFSTRQAPAPNTLDYGPIDGSVGRNAYNYDFTWHTEENGSPAAFCVNPGVPQPMRGSTYSRKDIINDNRIRTVLWYGYRGFNSIYDPHNEGTWGQHAGGTAEKQAWATHMLVSAYWLGRDPRAPNWSGPYGPNDTWSITNEEIMALPGYQQLLWLVENQPLSPNVDFHAWRLYVAIGTRLGENGTSGEVRDEWDQENAAQAMVSGVFKPTRIDVDTMIRDLDAINADRNRPLVDDITITPRATNGSPDEAAGWPAGEQLLVCSRLYFNANDGGADRTRERCTVANPATDVPGGTPYRLPRENTDALTFRPSDFPEATVGGGGVTWRSGHFWFDTYFDSRHVLDQPSYTGENMRFYSHVFDFAWGRGWWLYTNFIYDGNGNVVGEEEGEHFTLHDFATRKGGRGIDPDGHGAPVTDTVMVTAGGAHPEGQWARTWLYVDTAGGDTADMVCGADGADKGFGTRWELRFTDGSSASPQFTPGQCRMMDGQLPPVDGFGGFAGAGGNGGNATRGELTEWPGGHYWYDTKIALAPHLGGEYWHRGLMTGDDSESWTRRRQPRTQWTPTAVKTFDAGHSRADVTGFRVALYDADEDGKPGARRQTVAFGKDGKATFMPIDYREDVLEGKDSRTFVYALREEASADGGNGDKGIVFDTRTHVVRVTVRRDGDRLLAEDDQQGRTPEFTNVYRPSPATVKPTAIKTFDGGELSRTDITGFRFELIEGDGPDGTVLETRTVDAATVGETEAGSTTGKVNFSPIVYCAPTDDVTEGCPPRPRADPVGRHVYTVREVAGTAGGVTYDTRLHRYVVNVSDDGLGHLSATIAPSGDGSGADGGIEFVNSYRPEDTAVTLKARKAYREAGGRDLRVRDGQFAFELRDGDGRTVATASTADGGTVEFRGGTGAGEVPLLRFTAGDMAGKSTIERRFSIVELAGDDPHVTYDTRPREVTVTVSDDGVGHLVAKISHEANGTAPTVTNIRKTPMGLPVTGGFDLISAGVLVLVALLLAILGLRAMAAAVRAHAGSERGGGTGHHAA